MESQLIEQSAKTIFNIENLSGSEFNFSQELKQRFNPASLNNYQFIPCPTIVNSLLNDTLKRQSTLIINSDFIFDKGSLIRCLAYRLAISHNLKVMEWLGSGDRETLFQGLRGIEEPTILIVEDLTPQDVKFDLERLRLEVEERKHILIASSGIPFEAWNLNDNSHNLFTKLEQTDIQFTENEITKYLILKLETNKHHFDFEGPYKNLQEDTVLVGNTTVSQLATYFSFPEQVEKFIRLSKEKGGILEEDSLDNLAKKASQEEEFNLSSWFGPLKKAEKLIALGLALFSEFTEEQFFAAMQRLVKESWGRSSAELENLDYEDIIPFFDIFKFELATTADGDQYLISGRYSNHQNQLIEVVWNSYRRHLINALPIVYSLIRDSVENQYSDRELFGTRSKRQRIRRALAQTLSIIGQKSQDIVEPILLQLASHRDLGIQSVAAKAMAQWALPSSDSENKSVDLFDLLEQWQNNSKYIDSIQRFLSEDEKSNSESANSFLKATIVLTLGHATQFDPPKNKNNKLLNILNSFLSDRNPLVRSRISNALRYVIRSNGAYMEDNQWKRILIHNDLIENSAIGLTWAWQDDPDTVEKFLLNKLQAIKEIENGVEPLFGYTIRDRWAALLILFLGFLIQQEGGSTLIGSKRPSDWLWLLRASQPNPNLKQLVWQMHMTFGALANEQYEELEQRISSLSKDEEEMLLKGLGNQYLLERKALQGGDAKEKRDGELYTIWIDKPRPETKIEQLMYNWLLARGTNWNPEDDTTQRMLQQTGFMAFQEFARVFEYWEEQVIEKKLEERKLELERKEQNNKQYEYQQVESAMVPLNEGWFGKLWSSWFGSEKSNLIKGLKNILKNSPKFDLQFMWLLISKCKNKNDQDFNQVALSIEKALNKLNNQ
ncbi:MAG: hypothetical protein AAFX87_17220 [Bacteroidota bacterium]